MVLKHEVRRKEAQPGKRINPRQGIRGRGGYTGTIVGALILTVMTTLLTILQMPEGARRMLFGLIVLLVTAAYLRIIEDR